MTADTHSDGERTFSPEEKRTTFIALMIVFFLSALDQTIVSTAMPTIVSELNGLDLYPWVTTSYLLTSTVSVPIWGKLGDLFGRKRILVIGVVLFLIGSWLCGLSGEFGDAPVIGGGMMQLIVFRGLQGIGGGALFTTAFAVIADLFPPQDRAKYAGLFGAVFGLSSVIGPIVGGYFTDHGDIFLFGHEIEGWRWVFYLNLPTSALALIMIGARMPELGGQGGGRIDWAGAVFVVTAIGALMLALTWGPDKGWTSQAVLGLFLLSLVAGGVFLAIETRVSEPLLPLSLFGIRAFSTATLASFIISMAFMGTIVYLPLFLQIGLGVQATNSGLLLLPLMAGLILSATLAGRFVTRTGAYKPVMAGGAVIQILGVLLMAQLDASASDWDVTWRLFVVGVGLGPSQSLFNLVAQSAAPIRQIGVATSTSMFLRQTGAMVGVSIFGAILTSELTSRFSAFLPEGERIDLGQMEKFAMTARAAGGAAQTPPFLAEAFAGAMSAIFQASVLVVVLALIAIAFIPTISLRGRSAPQPAQAGGGGAG
jgi:EmrB/QacA subfamily drug resistance transporter